MPKCPHCGRDNGNKPLTFVCSNCGCTWCNNGNCTGRDGKSVSGSKESSLCPTCRKRGIRRL
jgi:hypothetical protein